MFYIDGFNFYYAISETSQRDLKRLKRGWCDFWALGERLVSLAFPGQKLGAVKYFTAKVGDLENRPDEAARQDLWLDALREGTQQRVRIVLGRHAKQENKARVEKQTDVNIAISMVRDAILSPIDAPGDAYPGDPLTPCDGIVLISGDIDLDPALRMADYYGVRPVRFSPEREVTDQMLLECQLPDVIDRRHGPPITWKDYCLLKSGSGRW
jgi:hypothetical protein